MSTGRLCPCSEEPARPRRSVLKDARLRRAGASAHGYPNDRSTKISGLTLIEVLVALTIASIVVLAAHQMFTGVADGARAVSSERQALDRHSNARRWLKATFLSLDAPFDGRANKISFTAWQLTPGGWFEPQPIEIGREGTQLLARHAGELLPLTDDVTEVAFDYLLDPGADSKWVREWISPVSAPLAIRMRLGRGTQEEGRVDTLLFLVKERG